MGKLRPYQEELVQRTSRSWRTGHKAPCIVLPCGGGKSVIVAEIAKRTTENGKSVLFLVHRKELCDQIRETFRWWGVDMALCNVMMVQTATRRLERMTQPGLIITDENHHSKASTYRKIYDRFSDVYRVGVTATPVRIDGSGLGDVNDDLIVGVSAKWLIDHHCLAPYDYYAPSEFDMLSVSTRHGEFDMAEAEKALSEQCIYGDVVKHYQTYAGGVKAVCYCVSIRYSKMMAEVFCDAGVPAAHIDGSTPKAERDRIIADFRSGAVQVLCNVDLISEGFDVPDCGCAILLRPTKSLTLYIQQAMRCMRYQDGKRAVILDHVGNVRRFGMPDDDREWTLETRQKKVADPFEIVACEQCFYIFPKYTKDGKLATCCPKCLTPLKKAAVELQREERDPAEKVEAKLEKVTEVHAVPAMPSQCRTFSDLSAYGKAKGYKPGWAYYMAKRMGLIQNDRRTPHSE